MAKKSEIDIDIIRRVKERRLKEKISLRTIASVIGTNHTFPAEVEKEGSSCKYSAVHLYRIGQYFDCPVTDFLPSYDTYPSLLEKPNR